MVGADRNPRDGAIRLLLVDDEAGFVSVLAKRMSRRGIRAVTAVTGGEAVQILRGQDFDVAVLDLKMEDMNGLEVLKIFKTMLPRMPVIMLTGHGSADSAREGLELGAFDYLTKPCDLDDLIAKIREAAKGKDSGK